MTPGDHSSALTAFVGIIRDALGPGVSEQMNPTSGYAFYWTTPRGAWRLEAPAHHHGVPTLAGPAGSWRLDGVGIHQADVVLMLLRATGGIPGGGCPQVRTMPCCAGVLGQAFVSDGRIVCGYCGELHAPTGRRVLLGDPRMPGQPGRPVSPGPATGRAGVRPPDRDGAPDWVLRARDNAAREDLHRYDAAVYPWPIPDGWWLIGWDDDGTAVMIGPGERTANVDPSVSCDVVYRDETGGRVCITFGPPDPPATAERDGYVPPAAETAPAVAGSDLPPRGGGLEGSPTRSYPGPSEDWTHSGAHHVQPEPAPAPYDPPAQSPAPPSAPDTSSSSAPSYDGGGGGGW